MQQIERDTGQMFIPLGMRAIAEDLPPEATLLAARIDAGAAWLAVDAAGVPIGYAIASVVDGEGPVDQVSVVPDATGRASAARSWGASTHGRWPSARAR
ncbi:MAG: hypothetical protein IAG13_25720 [Deltaproteobacteria bacterium]|nr:hypothetical protein [Nannocystaceae bacterium]